jgi:hypothetical protein
MVVCLQLLPLNAAKAEDPLVEQAQATLNVLNPISLTVNGLIDNAIKKGDSALQKRLEQLNGIIQSAIFNLDQALRNRIDQLNQASKDRIAQTLSGLTDSLRQLDQIIQGGIEGLDTRLASRIRQLQTEVGNVVAGLPVPFDPVLNVGEEGIFLVKQEGAVSSVFVTGAGLFKKGYKPQAWLILPDGKRELAVPASSMGLVEVQVPNALSPDALQPTKRYIELKLRRGGWLIPSYSAPSFPVHLCGRMQGYSVTASLSASGQVWERRVVLHPHQRDNVKGYGKGFYIETNNKPVRQDFCAIPFDGWDVDPEAPGFDHGLKVTAEDGGGYHDHGSAGTGCRFIYADTRNGNANAWAGDVLVAQKRLVAKNPCSQPSQSTALLRYGLTQVQLDVQASLGACVAGLSMDPSYNTHVEVRDPNGIVLERRDVRLGQSDRALGGALQIRVNAQGLVDIDLTPLCRRAP